MDIVNLYLPFKVQLRLYVDFLVHTAPQQVMLSHLYAVATPRLQAPQGRGLGLLALLPS